MNKLDVVFNIKTNNYIGLAAILLVNQNPTQDGVEGYLINVNRQPGQEYYQVYALSNFYGTTQGSHDYIGGWVYTDSYSGETVVNNDLRVSSVSVDLSNQGPYTLLETVNFGLVIWHSNGQSIDFVFDELATSETFNSSTKIKKNFGKVYSLFNIELYFEEKERLGQIKQRVENYNVNDEATYENIKNDIKEIKNILTKKGK